MALTLPAALPAQGLTGSGGYEPLLLYPDARWTQSGTTLTVNAPRAARTAVAATVISSLGGIVKFDGTHAARFTCSLNGTDYAATQTVGAGATTVYLAVTPTVDDSTLSARVGVPV